MKKSFFSAAAIFLLLALSYLYLDQPAALWCHEHLDSQDQKIFKFITQFGDSTFSLIGFAVAFFLFRYVRKNPKGENISLFFFGSVAVSGIAADIVKVIAGRYRPSELFEHGLYGFDFFHIERAMTSFPSGHTATAFALAMAVAYLWPRWRVVTWAFAILIGISRLAIGAHYPSDIMGGAVLGIVSTLALIGYWNKAERFKNNPLR